MNRKHIAEIKFNKNKRNDIFKSNILLGCV